MKALVQRVSEASVTVDGETTGSIGRGLLVFICAERDDTEAVVGKMARKVAGLRIFGDAEGKMNLSVKDVGGGVLAVSQFTLAGDCRKGFRPSFVGAEEPGRAEDLYEKFCAAVEAEGVPVERGRFAADMKVALLNDGPVTIWLDMPAAGQGAG